MHLLFVTRGINREVNAFVNAIDSWDLKWNKKNTKTNIIEDHVIETRLQPIQMWDLVFPKQALDLMLNRIRPSSEFTGTQSHLNKYTAFMRKRLGAQKIPDWDRNAPITMIEKGPNVQRFGIGIKEDPIRQVGDYEQELL